MTPCVCVCILLAAFSSWFHGPRVFVCAPSPWLLSLLGFMVPVFLCVPHPLGWFLFLVSWSPCVFVCAPSPWLLSLPCLMTPFVGVCSPWLLPLLGLMVLCAFVCPINPSTSLLSHPSLINPMFVCAPSLWLLSILGLMVPRVCECPILLVAFSSSPVFACVPSLLLLSWLDGPRILVCPIHPSLGCFLLGLIISCASVCPSLWLVPLLGLMFLCVSVFPIPLGGIQSK